MGSSKSAYQMFWRVNVVLSIAVGVGLWLLMPPAAEAWRGALPFLAILIGLEILPVSAKAHAAEFTLTAPIYWAAVTLFGPFITMLMAAIAYATVQSTSWVCARYVAASGESHPDGLIWSAVSLLAGFWGNRAEYPVLWSMKLIVLNIALTSLLAGIPAIIYTSASGIVGVSHLQDHLTLVRAILHVFMPFVAGIGTCFLVDGVQYVTARIVSENRPEDTRDWYSFVLRWKMLLLETVPLTWRQYLLLPPITVLLVYLYIHLGAWAGLVVLGPFLTFRLSVQKAVEQQQIYLDTVAMLGTYMQHYHPYTRGHLKRVADMSERLARELKLPAETVVLMPYAGLLHDIGKVGVSDEILDKVGKLTDDEWASIKEHPVKGAEIITHLDFLNRTVDWVKYHHKWVDGSGYPDDGAKNGGVPIEAAIIAVADAFDAMTDDREMSLDWTCDSCGYKPDDGLRPDVCPQCNAPKRRVYRQPLTTDDAINELRRGAGSQFEPGVVKAFLTMVEREGIRVGGSG